MVVVRAASRLALAAVAAVLGSAMLASSAFAHADLLRVSPRDGQVLERSPRAVVLTFDEGIDPAFIRLRVQDAAGRRIERGDPYHPGDREEVLAVRLQPGLDGSYAASYRVISEDGHPVTRRTTFRVRAPAPAEEEMRDDQPAAPTEDEGAMAPAPDGRGMPPTGGESALGHEEGESGAITDAAFAAARGLGYLAMALAVGGVVFLLVIWLPALGHVAGAGTEWGRLSERFARRARGVVLGAALLGVVSTALAIVLEAATAAGVSFWAALDRDALEFVSETRVVEAWSARLVVWLVLAALVVAIMRPARMPVLRRASLGAAGTALSSGPSRSQALVLFAAIGALAMTAPLAGHAASYSPRGLLAGADTVHVLSMCTWLGGLVMLILAIPLATRALVAEDATPLLATVVGRFSRMAMIAVTLLLLSGIVNSVVLVASFDALVETAYGRLVLAKIALFGALISLGAINQRRMLPQLRALAARGDPPGRAAATLRRSVATEVTFALLVLGVTSVLVATQPAATT
jgi:copper transport protein